MLFWGWLSNLKRVAALNHQKAVTNHANLHSESVQKKRQFDQSSSLKCLFHFFFILNCLMLEKKLVFLSFTKSSSIEISISSVMLDNNGSYVNIHKLPKLNYLSGDSEIEKGKQKETFYYLQNIGHLGSELFSRLTISKTK